MDLERNLSLIVVWTLFGTSVVQSGIHFVTWWTVHRQESATAVGQTLAHRELSLAVKMFVRLFFDLLLAILLTWGVLYLNTGQRETLYFILAVVAVIAAYYGIAFLVSLRRESYGRPDASSFSTETAETIDHTAATVDEVALDVKSIQQRMDTMDERT